ncbi:cell filamentation protein Fic [Candidatus Termititenax persephonae]|uniref:Cell filamentation protein Fic n=1 Tax=Candidatus Termititenax persephonae TaxID=2218525 RepID=A0A388TIG9_9BACT|nr:cell filamentation protein Fic [Candidatus Termititenax persephonae]
MNIHFLTLSEVLLILEDQIRNYGGLYGVRDLNLLSSAINMPQSSFQGEYLHKTIPAMAATYVYHICQNHPFIDGNKRVALASSLVFLAINGYAFNCPGEIVYKEIIAVAKGEIKKEELIKYYKKYSKKK